MVRLAGVIEGSYSSPIVQVSHTNWADEGPELRASRYYTNYQHLSAWNVTVGEWVEKGRLLRISGVSAAAIESPREGAQRLTIPNRDALRKHAVCSWQIYLVVCPVPDRPYGDIIAIELLVSRPGRVVNQPAAR